MDTGAWSGKSIVPLWRLAVQRTSKLCNCPSKAASGVPASLLRRRLSHQQQQQHRRRHSSGDFFDTVGVRPISH